MYVGKRESTAWARIGTLCLGVVQDITFVAKFLPSTVPCHHIDSCVKGRRRNRRRRRRSRSRSRSRSRRRRRRSRRRSRSRSKSKTKTGAREIARARPRASERAGAKARALFLDEGTPSALGSAPEH